MSNENSDVNSLRLKFLGPVAESAGATLRDLWDLLFGPFGDYVERKRTSRLKDLNAFKDSLEEKVAAIPESRLCEPSLSVIGPALEASKYHYEEEKIREMFANLIAASMDSQTKNAVHPSFSEIIKQMSALDAKTLAVFSGALPIAEYRLLIPDDSFITLMRDIFLDNPAETNLELQAQSISSLCRHGLIETSYDKWLTQEGLYDKFAKTDLFLNLKNEYGSGENKLTVQNGMAYLTPLGENFKAICVG